VKKDSPQELIKNVKELIADSSIRFIVERRVKEFQCTKTKSSPSWFEELTFCILTANSKAEMGLKCVEVLKRRNLVFTGSQEVVATSLKEMGHRFALLRAEYIVSARKKIDTLKDEVLSFSSSAAAREWLVKEFRGIGWKESSHFLRNVGFLDLAILDRHILKIMLENKLISKHPKSLTRKKYLEFEDILREFSFGIDMPLGKLDLYLWYMKTGKILK
jgi:N-glycosylase/DNA lyase